MVSISELTKIEMILAQAADARICADYVNKIRRWLAAGQATPDVKRRLEHLIGRFGNVRFARAAGRPN